ncbi:MAG: hypothetical protein AAB606_01190, partial [Patescibacteria group bacterium]
VLENPKIPNSTKEVLKAEIDAALKMLSFTETSQQIETGQINTELRDALKEPTAPVGSADRVHESVEKFEKHIVDCWNDSIQHCKDESDFVDIFERSLKSLVPSVVITMLPNLIGIKAPEKSGKSWYIVFRGHPQDGIGPSGLRFYNSEGRRSYILNEVRLIKPASLDACLNDWWHPDINKKQRDEIHNIEHIAERGEFRPI